MHLAIEYLFVSSGDPLYFWFGYWMLVYGIFWQEIDLRIGASFTRFQTMLLRDAFILDFAGDDRNVILSYGPCQVCLIVT